MLTTFYSLSRNPFDKHAQRSAESFRSNDFKTMQGRLDYLVEVRGIGVFTASPDMGKTYAIRCFEHSLNKNLYQTAYICLSTVFVQEFYAQFCSVLGLEPAFRKTTIRSQLPVRRKITKASMNQQICNPVHFYAVIQRHVSQIFQ